MNVDRVEKNLGKMIKLVKEKNQYRNQFRNKYYEYYNKMKRLKKPIVYSIMLFISIGCCFGAVISAIWNAVCNDNSNYWLEISLYISAIVLLRLADSKYIFRRFKEKLLEKSLRAIDSVFNDICGKKDSIYKERYIRVFAKKYNESLWRLTSKCISKTWLYLFVIIHMLMPNLGESVSGRSNIFWVVMIAFECISINLSSLENKMFGDYLYDRVISEYGDYLNERIIREFDKK